MQEMWSLACCPNASGLYKRSKDSSSNAERVVIQTEISKVVKT